MIRLKLNKYRLNGVVVLAFTLFCATAFAQLQGRHAGSNIVIGLEYAGLDNPPYTRALAETLSQTGLTGMKHYAEAVAWGKIQTAPDQPIDFSLLDRFVKSFQDQGFTQLTIALKSHSNWASKQVGFFRASNPTPKPRFRHLYHAWIQAVVERYDADGKQDMPGLRWPVSYYEIGNEFSSYEPEPVHEYLDMLAIAYRAAHQAYPEVKLTHAAFLTTPVNLDVQSPSDYQKVWDRTPRHDRHHGLKDQRIVLDHPGRFDVINIHNLGDPYEIEHIVRWLNYEMRARGYRKPIIISDTLPTSYIAWGQATNCRAAVKGTLIPPATERDRCRLAGYFNRLIDKHQATLNWTRSFIAADHVQRTIIAAEQGIELINLSFITDLPFLTNRFAQAGAGISAWGGAIEITPWGQVKEKRPLFYSIEQMMRHLAGYRSIQRVPHNNQRIRLYKISKQGRDSWVAWLQPNGVLLPGDNNSTKALLKLGRSAVTVEQMAITENRPAARFRLNSNSEQSININLTHSPVYIY